MSKKSPLLTVGITGTAITAACCFTPLLVVLLGGLGLSAWLGWIDWVLLPLLGLFVALTVLALVAKRREKNRE
jgi:mercuric ion transport protein